MPEICRLPPNPVPGGTGLQGLTESLLEHLGICHTENIKTQLCQQVSNKNYYFPLIPSPQKQVNGEERAGVGRQGEKTDLPSKAGG